MRAKRQCLHVVCGPPAAGKSVHGRALAGRLGAAFLDSDTVSERIVQAGLRVAGLSPDDRDSPVYKSHFREAVYETLFILAEENLPQVPVVIAGPFTRESQEAGWLGRLEARFRTAVEIHFVRADPEVRRERMVARGSERDRAKLADWEGYLATCAEGPPPFPHTWVEG